MCRFDNLPNSFQLSYINICQFLLPSHTHKIACLKCYRIDDDEDDDGGVAIAVVVVDDNNENNGCFLLLSVHLRCSRCRSPSSASSLLDRLFQKLPIYGKHHFPLRTIARNL